MNILLIGDVVARPGRDSVDNILPGIIEELKIDLVVANIENLAHGKGATRETVNQLRKSGVDLFTSGNHIWFREEFLDELENDETVTRPANYPEDVPGRGHTFHKVGKEKVMLINLIGRQWIDQPINDPFRKMDELLKLGKKEKANVILVDFHAEATSEKSAMGWYLDGQVTALVGTHTHVPTADAWILPEGTGFVSDIGMTGARHSVLGVAPEIIISTQKNPGPQKFEWVEDGPKVFNSVFIRTDSKGNCSEIARIDRILPD
jgi:metallophosphoesterase (TIGR00282 family)